MQQCLFDARLPLTRHPHYLLSICRYFGMLQAERERAEQRKAALLKERALVERASLGEPLCVEITSVLQCTYDVVQAASSQTKLLLWPSCFQQTPVVSCKTSICPPPARQSHANGNERMHAFLRTCGAIFLSISYTSTNTYYYY